MTWHWFSCSSTFKFVLLQLNNLHSPTISHLEKYQHLKSQLASTTAPRLTATAFISQLLMTQIWGSTSSPRLAAVQSLDPAWPAASPAACYRTPESSNTLLLPAMQGQFSLRRSLLSWLKNFSGFHSLIDFHFSTFAGSVSFGSGTLFSFVSDPTAHLAASV